MNRTAVFHCNDFKCKILKLTQFTPVEKSTIALIKVYNTILLTTYSQDKYTSQIFPCCKYSKYIQDSYYKNRNASCDKTKIFQSQEKETK